MRRRRDADGYEGGHEDGEHQHDGAGSRTSGSRIGDRRNEGNGRVISVSDITGDATTTRRYRNRVNKLEARGRDNDPRRYDMRYQLQQLHGRPWTLRKADLHERA